MTCRPIPLHHIARAMNDARAVGSYQGPLLGYIPRIELWFSGVVLGWIVFDGLTR